MIDKQTMLQNIKNEGNSKIVKEADCIFRSMLTNHCVDTYHQSDDVYPLKLSIIASQTGDLTKVEAYVAILSYSQLTFVQAVFTQRKEDFIETTKNALRVFGGVHRVLVPDNLKSAINKADLNEAVKNVAFQDFANH